MVPVSVGTTVVKKELPYVDKRDTLAPTPPGPPHMVLVTPSPRGHNPTLVGTVIMSYPIHLAPAMSTTSPPPWEKILRTIPTVTAPVTRGAVCSLTGEEETRSSVPGAPTASSLVSGHVSHTMIANKPPVGGLILRSKTGGCKSIPHAPTASMVSPVTKVGIN